MAVPQETMGKGVVWCLAVCHVSVITNYVAGIELFALDSTVKGEVFADGDI